MTVDTTELRRLLAGATPSPWEMREREATPRWHVVNPRTSETRLGLGMDFQHYIPICEFDAALIVAAVDALPELLDRIDRIARLEEIAELAREIRGAANIGYADGTTDDRHVNAFGAALDRLDEA